jgi:hypothetical protein
VLLNTDLHFPFIVMVLVDDSTNVLLVIAFVLLGITLLQLLGCISRQWNFLTISIFLTAVILQWWNLNASFLDGSIQQYAFSYMFIVFGTLSVYIVVDNVGSVVVGLIAFAVVVASLAWGYQAATDWIDQQTGIDLNLLTYLILLTVICLLCLFLGLFIFNRKWLRRVVEVVFVTFICALSILVIYRRDPSNGFDQTSIEILDFNTFFWVLWAMTFLIYIVLYWFMYRNLPWHPDRDHDNKESFWKEEKKQQKQHKKVIPTITIPPSPEPESHPLISDSDRLESILYQDSNRQHHHHHRHRETALADHPEMQKLLYPDLAVS